MILHAIVIGLVLGVVVWCLLGLFFLGRCCMRFCDWWEDQERRQKRAKYRYYGVKLQEDQNTTPS